MALGYTIGTIMRRTSVVYSDEKITVKVDDVEGMACKFVQVSCQEHLSLCSPEFAIAVSIGGSF